MTQLNEVPAEDDPTHLLLIGETKMGKSTYAAQAAIDGYLVIYIDSDNGISAIRHALRNHPEAMKNILYFQTEKPYTFTNGFLTEGIFRWNLTKDKAYSSGMDSPSDRIVELIPSRIPKQAIVNIDTWSTVSLDAMELGASKKSVRLEELSGSEAMQGVYGDASMKLTLLCAVIQHCKFHVIVQAHGTNYEIYEKPLGAGPYKQRDMILKENIKIPLSSSRPHGYNMGKYFNQIGWLELNRMDQVVLDFTRKHGRVGGGTPSKAGPIESMSFAKLFGPVQETPAIDKSWIRYMTSAEFVAAKKATTPSSPKPAGVSESGAIKKPANPLLSKMLAAKS